MKKIYTKPETKKFSVTTLTNICESSGVTNVYYKRNTDVCMEEEVAVEDWPKAQSLWDENTDE